MLRVGLLRYAVQSGWGGDFDLCFDRDLGAQADGGTADGESSEQVAFQDPWNYWTFRVGLSADLDLRQSRSDTPYQWGSPFANVVNTRFPISVR